MQELGVRSGVGSQILTGDENCRQWHAEFGVEYDKAKGQERRRGQTVHVLRNRMYARTASLIYLNKTTSG